MNAISNETLNLTFRRAYMQPVEKGTMAEMALQGHQILGRLRLGADSDPAQSNSSIEFEWILIKLQRGLSIIGNFEPRAVCDSGAEFLWP